MMIEWFFLAWFFAICFFLLWLIVSFKNLFFYTYLWQLKEYRFDRLRAHFKTRQGSRDLFSFLFVLKIFLFLAFVFDLAYFGKDLLAGWRILVLTILLLFGFLEVLVKTFFRRMKRPRLTLKAWLLIGFSFLGQMVFISIFWFKLGFFSIAFLGAILFLPVLVTVSTVLLSLPTRLVKARIIKKARQKIKDQPDLKVIGVTGSFGKTSTKEFLAQILSSRFKVLFTREHNNTDIGVAKQILEELSLEHEVYVVEMGAYKKGEIAAICRIVSPQVAIITGLGHQHLSLFGSLANLLEAKFELIDSLPGGGRVVLNGDDKFCMKFARRTALSKIIFSAQGKKGDLYAKKVKVFKKRIEFEVKKGRRSQVFKAPFLGRQNVGNLLAAIGGASFLGMGLTEIAKKLRGLRSLPGTMNFLEGPNGSSLIDDAYNSNPEGVLAALSYLKVFKGRRFLVFQPMIELGEATFIEHRRVIKKAVGICDKIFLTNQNFYRQIVGGVNKRFRERILPIRSSRWMFEKFFVDLNSGDVVLFEGREAAEYLKLFLKPKV